MNNNELEGESGWVCARAEEMGGRNAGINTISKANEKQPKLSEDTEYNSSYPLEWERFFLLFSPLSPGHDWMALGHMFWLHGKKHKQRETQEFSLKMTHYLEHVRVFIVCVLHHHGLVPRQSVGYAVLAFAADSLIVRGEKKNHLNLILATGQSSVPAHSPLSTRKTQHWPELSPRSVLKSREVKM